MTINHINLPVENVKDVHHLFESFLGFTCRSVKGEHSIVILDNPEGFTLVLMPLSKKGPAVYPELFHIGILMKNQPEVEGLYQKLKAGGISLPTEPGKIRDGFGFYFQYDALLIEIGLN